MDNPISLKCPRHPSEDLCLVCGKCGKQICTRCLTLTGEGVRCPECMDRLNSDPSTSSSPNWTFEPRQEVIEAPTPFNQRSTRGEKRASDLIDIDPLTGESYTNISFCERHRSIETGLRCGICQAFICPRCMIFSPGGLRCPTCYSRSPGTNRGETPLKNSQRSGPLYRSNRSNTSLFYLFQSGLAGLAAALLGGIAWGFFLDASSSSPQNAGRIFAGSIHIVPEFLLGVFVGEMVARAARERKGRAFQLVAALNFFIGLLISIATLITRLELQKGNPFPPLLDLARNTWNTFGGLFSSGSSGTSLALLIFISLGIGTAWYRLRP